MDYAQNPHHVGVIPRIFEWLETPLADEKIQKWVLFDGAVLGEKLTKKTSMSFGSNRVYNLFSTSEFSVYGWGSAHLIALDLDAVSRNALDTLLRCSSGLPGVSILEGSANRKRMRDLLVSLAHARTSDGLNLYCRLADTRIAPVLIDVLSLEQRETLSKTILNWQIVGRQGLLETLFSSSKPLPTRAVAGELLEPLVLSDAQYSKMMRMSEADEIFQMLCDGAPELVPISDRGDFQRLLAGIIAAAHARKIELTSEIYQFSVIALTTRPDFFLLPVLDTFWDKLRIWPNTFSRLVDEWDDATWSSLTHDEIVPSSIAPENGVHS
jgi:hypothetical protein